MTYLVSQLWFCLLLAWMLGNIVGWLLRGGCSAHLKRVEKNWQERYLTLEEEKESYVAQVNKLRLLDDETDTLTEQLAKCQQVERLNSQLRSHLKDIEIGAKVIQAELRTKNQALVKSQQTLIASKKIIQEKDETLYKLARRLKVERHQLNGYKLRLSDYGTQYGKQLEGLKIALNKAQQQSGTYKTERDEKDEQLDKVQRQLEELTNEFDNTTSKLADIKASLAKQDESVEMLTSTVTIRDEMVEYYEKQLETITSEKTAISNKLEGLANEFAKVASAMMKAKSEQAASDQRHQEKVQQISTQLKNAEDKRIQADEVLAKKEQALQERLTPTQGKSKLHRLQRELKRVKKKLKAVTDKEGDGRIALGLTVGNDEFIEKDDDVEYDAEEVQQSLTGTADEIVLLGINKKIEIIRGIGSGQGARLRKLGIATNHDLLQCVISPQDEQSLAQKISCKVTDILLWKKMADFLRIKGVDAEFAQLLALSRLNSVQDIATSNAMQLLDKMKVAIKTERRIRRLPELDEVNQWIHDAKRLDDGNHNISLSLS